MSIFRGCLFFQSPIFMPMMVGIDCWRRCYVCPTDEIHMLADQGQWVAVWALWSWFKNLQCSPGSSKQIVRWGACLVDSVYPWVIGYVKQDSCGEDSALSCSSAFVSIIGLLALACSVHCIDMHSSIINYTSTKLALYYCDIWYQIHKTNIGNFVKLLLKVIFLQK